MNRKLQKIMNNELTFDRRETLYTFALETCPSAFFCTYHHLKQLTEWLSMYLGRYFRDSQRIRTLKKVLLKSIFFLKTSQINYQPMLPIFLANSVF